jgi:8-oxo-dGTP pyrophosphatase MutT (NUDIX family)
MCAERVVAATWLSWRGSAVLGVRPRGATVFFLPGGLPEPGETLAEAAAREAGEETGVLVAANDLIEVVRIEAPPRGPNALRRRGVHCDGLPMGLAVQCLDIDAADPQTLATFWQQALGWRRTHDTESGVVLEPPEGSLEDGVVPDLLFNRVQPPRRERTGSISTFDPTTRGRRSPGSPASARAAWTWGSRPTSPGS